MYLRQGLIMKKIIFSILVCTFLSCQENRPHGNQYNLPELTPNNFLMGNLNDNRSSYRVSFYDINIDFDIVNKSLNGFVTIKAESIRDLNSLQIDLAENLNIDSIIFQNEEVSFSREYDAVFLKTQITHPGQVDSHGQKTKMEEIGLQYLVKAKEQEFGGLIKIILQLRVIVLECRIQFLQV